ncbi:MAG TPA: hypothetical protein VGD84_21930 [Pseudonocardiaceae bacterium]
MRLFRRKPTPTTDSGGHEIGILFDINELGGGTYGHKAYRIVFDALDPHRLSGCSVHDGDTNATFYRGASEYCIAIRCPDATTVDYIRTTMTARTDAGLPPPARRFADGNVTAREPLVPAGTIDRKGNFVIRPDDMIRPTWGEGTGWTLIIQP